MTETLTYQTGTFTTDHASKYLQQLCKHFAHKIEVEYDPLSARMALPTGPATLAADDDRLTARISGADDAALDRARHIIDDHLKRFDHRENFEAMDWQAA